MTYDNDNVQELVAEPVSRESENPPGNESSVANFVNDWLRERGVDASLIREHSTAIAVVNDDPWAIPASTDVRNHVNDADMEAITWGPGDLDQAPTFDEHVAIDEVATAFDVLESALVDLFEGEA